MNRLFFGLFAIYIALQPLAIAQADEFVVDPEYLVSDTEMLDVYSMSLVDIERFLIRGALDEYVGPDVNDEELSAAEIIFNAAQEFDLSPRFLLVLLQREQSLIEDDSLSQDQLDWAMGYAVCDDCSKDDPRIAKFMGFGNQVYYAAQRIRESYIEDLESRGYTETGMGPGIEKSIDGTFVTPVNNATAALYTYTPHLHGNENFARIWDRWFTYEYVTGSLLQDKESGGIWLIQYGERRPITSRTAFYSRFNPSTVVQVSSTTLDQYPIGAPISFPNYSLLRSPGGTVYLIVDDARRGFVSMEAFRSLGFSTDEIVDVEWSDLDSYIEGEPLTLTSSYAQGALLQDTTTGGVFWVENGEKHSIFSREILANRFSNTPLTPASAEDLEAFEQGDAVLFQDGTLTGVPGSPDVFVISEGKRRPIVDELTFYSFGWDWSHVVWTSERAVLEHPLGEPLDVDTQFEEDEIEVASEPSQGL
ncbi:hypothetical protein EPN81_03665 [Patescibacteria group bacterium]|nr:MAG: hypothetical protein EPN81_03665 [Patescibacteria group bacterium]